MSDIRKEFNERVKNEFKYLGFKKYQNNFYRVTNDIFQSFGMQKSVSGDACIVNFVVVPLCAGGVISKTYCGPDHLKIFEDNWAWFDYDRNDENDIQNCVEEIIFYMKRYLFPFFERSNDCKNAYREVSKFQMEHYNGISFHSYLFSMALKSGFYEKSIYHLIAMKEQTQKAFERNKAHYNYPDDCEYTIRINSELKSMDEQIKLISDRDFEYINQYIRDRENTALKNLGMLSNS